MGLKEEIFADFFAELEKHPEVHPNFLSDLKSAVASGNLGEDNLVQMLEGEYNRGHKSTKR
jgi:hypothetical protein